MFAFNIKKLFFLLVLLVGFVGVFYAGISVGYSQVVCPTCKPETVDFSLFWDAYGKLHQNFIYPEKISNQKVIYGAISGMTESLDDPYTSFFNPEEARAFQQDLAGSFDGIGIEVGIKKGQLTIISPLKGTPGEKAGLQAGDQIVKIDGKSSQDMTIDEAITAIRGRKGTAITLTIFREGWNETKDFKIIRDTIKLNTVEWELKDKDVALIRIHQFDQTLSSDFKTIALEILKSPAKKIVLDLRNNPGGYLEVSQDIAGWFLERGQIITIEDFGKHKEEHLYKAEGNASFVNFPTVVLINKGSASASEILAGALRDNRNIKLVGEKSFGKGSVQEVINLAGSESFLKITIAKWLTPKRASISEVGLMPDVKVDANNEAGNDAQLEKALEIIKGLK